MVYVEWVDHSADGRWFDKEDADLDSECLCGSVGWLFSENEHRIILVSSINDTQVGNRQYIEKKLIRTLKTLRKGPRVRSAMTPEQVDESGISVGNGEK